MKDFPLNVAIFASGGGSNAQAIADAIRDGKLNARIGLCVSNKIDAGVLLRMEELDIPTVVLSPRFFESDQVYTDQILHELESKDINFIALAGYLRKVPTEVVRRFKNRLVNIHPALLPSFGGKGYYGRRVHEAVLEYGVKWTGVTVHLVDEEYDMGPIVLQEPVRVEPGDTPETLAARVLELEHRVYPEAIGLFAEGRITVKGRKVVVGPRNAKR
ncbi:MAG TPA: phosphoribosylglycinamide formyltransferase [Rhodothermales bacterium]|nr:phosphoribosylglycinamide formyltransferase [Rhodothermales bacterium]